MRRISLALCVAVVVATGCSTPSYVTKPASALEQKSGDKVAHDMVNALGGMDAYRRLKHVEFDFVVEIMGREVTRRTHAWDPSRNLSYVRFENKGEVLEVYQHLHQPQLKDASKGRAGVVFADGKQLPQTDIGNVVDEAYAMWINDTYWLVAPYKVFDAGVQRAYVDGKLRLSFDSVGLTPGDVYLFAVDDDGRPKMWSFFLESGSSADVAYQTPVSVDGVTFYLDRDASFGHISFQNLRVNNDAVDDQRFAPLTSTTR